MRVEAYKTAVRRAVSSLRRAPAFVAIAVSSLGIALGISTTVLAHIDSLTHPHVPVRDADRLYHVWVSGDGAISDPTGGDIRDMLQHMSSFEGVVGPEARYASIEVGTMGGQAFAAAVPPNYFDLLGITPRLGRRFTADETDASGVAIVSDKLWRTLFQNRDAIGSSVLTFAGRQYSVVGVMPRGLERIDRPDLFFPTPSRLSRYTFFLARLKRDATEARARTEGKGVADRIASTYGVGRRAWTFMMMSAKPDPLQLQAYHGAMIGAAICILVIACANVAALMLARGVTKRRDHSLRLALGASGRDLMMEVTAEVSVLALAGAACGVLLASWIMHIVSGIVPEQLAALGIGDPRWSWRVFAESLLAVLTAIGLAAALPAWYATKVSPNEPLKDSAGTTTGRAGSRFRLLVVAELAISMVLLLGSSLIAKATRKVSEFDFGYDARSLVVARTNLVVLPDAKADVAARNNANPGNGVDLTASEFQNAVERVKVIPGVQDAVAMSTAIPEKMLVISDVTVTGGSPLLLRSYLNVGGGFFHTIGIRIVEGRDFDEGDRTGQGAVILDQSAAKVLFPDGNAVGRLVKLGDTESRLPWVPVVGIAHDARLSFPQEAEMENEPAVYASVPATSAIRQSRILVRPSRGSLGVQLSVQRVLRDFFPPRTFVLVTDWLSNFEVQLQARRFTAGMFVALGVMSLVLAAAGLFSVLSYAVGQRMREFAVRVALGAQGGDVLRLVLRDGLVMALGGTAIGAVFGMWAGFLLNSWLWGVYPVDAPSLVVAEGALLAVTMASCLMPALRATRADPLEILRAN